MKTIKIIDLLNKIANGEEVPKIKLDGKVYDFCTTCFANNENGNLIWKFPLDALNEKVEIIEEEKEIEPLVYDEDCTNEWCIKELYEKVYELTEAINGIRKEK